MQLEDIRAQSLFKNLRFKVSLDGIPYTYDILNNINNSYYMQHYGKRAIEHADP